MTAKKIPYRLFSGQRKTAEKTSFFNTLRSVATVTTPRAHKNNDDDERRNGRRLRVAIVGGGAAGMTTALHLAPLVAAGLIQGPVDVYEANDVKQSNKLRTSGHTNTKFTSTSGNLPEGGKQLYAGSGALGRHIGVGIWSTAWWPFLRSLEKGLSSSSGTSNNNSASTSSLTDIINEQKNRQSYKTLLKDLEACGSYVKDVGYRSPKGTWLVKSQLNASPYGINDLLHGTTMSTTSTAENHGSKKKAKSIDNDDPALLFVREKDLLSCLRNAIKIEQQLGTVKYNCGVRVECIDSLAGDTGSLELHHHTNENGSVSSSSSASTTTSPQYHLIIAADGLRSSLRSRYAGHHSIHATGLGMESSSQKEVENNPFFRWEHTDGHREAIRVENRGYIVFRGNAPKLTEDAEDGSGSFQTWGWEKSMRFAAVPFRHAVEDLDVDDDGNTSVGHYSQTDTFKQRKKDEEVWFATINDPIFIDACKKNASEVNAEERKQLLLDAFGSWHNPVKTLIETTPAEGIMYEMALAHKHNAGPVFDIKTIMDFERWKKKKRKEEGAAERETVDKEDENNPSKKAFGPGPILVFIGDSMMTVDPVLAQGFTVAMESGASISRSIELALSSPSYSQELLRRELSERHARRERRLIHLLRTTEIVERLAQPHGLAIFAKYVVRPLMKFCPDGVKQGVFNFIIRYSLGLTGGERDSGGKQ